MVLEGGMPRAVAIVSPLSDGSSTTRAPWTPLSVEEKKKIHYVSKLVNQ